MTFLAASLLGSAAAHAAELFHYEDPRGDDDGAGGVLYPNRPDMKPGDLDLTAFAGRKSADGVWFIVEFARPVRDPHGQVTQVGPTPLDQLAPHGFYTFNVDVYIDEDGVPGSGRTESLPGRRVEMAREFAWERAVILTPRPDVASSLMEQYYDAVFEAEARAARGRVGKDELAAAHARSREEVRRHYFFPDRINVSGRRVEFFVPQSFLGEPAEPSWGYTVFVTGADLEQLGRGGDSLARRPKMMTMPFTRGARYDAFGLRADADIEMPPIVDLLAPDAATQYRALMDYDSVAGRLARVTGMGPPERTRAVAQSTPPRAPSPATVIAPPSANAPAPILTPAPKPTPPTPPTPPRPPVHALESTPAQAPAPATSAPHSNTGDDRSAAARLRTLKQLLDQNLITPDEYAQMRRKILSEL